MRQDHEKGTEVSYHFLITKPGNFHFEPEPIWSEIRASFALLGHSYQRKALLEHMHTQHEVCTRLGDIATSLASKR